ncbi:MAG: mandelate racemase/muconate lactonizing enzyme family protein [Chloroflexota bacterium]
MKIKTIKAFPLAYPEPHYNGIERYITLARIETEDGLVGWGECISQFREAALATKVIIEEGFAPLLKGENILDTSRLWHQMLDRIWWYGPEGIAAFAVSAVDMALWDVKGKALGVPVCRLLGGKVHDKVVAMASFIFDMEDFDWTVNEFTWLLEQGYWMVKAGWGMNPEARFGQDRKADIEIVRRIREAIGDEPELIVDTPGIYRYWDVPTAIQRFRELEPYRLRWIEQPLLPSDLEGHAQLRAAVSTPIGTGEDEWDVQSYKRLIESGGVDVFQVDPGRVHGISGFQHVVKLIEAANLEVSAHTWSSALNTAASIHLLANTPNAVSIDFKPHESPMQHELVSNPWVQEDGYVTVPDTPGLGVEVREEIVQKYQFG